MHATADAGPLRWNHGSPVDEATTTPQRKRLTSAVSTEE